MRYVCILLCLSFIVAGCSQTARYHAPSSPDTVRSQSRQPADSRSVEPDNGASTTERLELLARAVPGVESATCVVVGKTAVVGINVKGSLDRSRVGTIKYSVAEALSKDPVGIHAIVTADIDIGNRLREMRRDIDKGRPVSGFAEEMADIIGRIMPQFPKDITPLETPMEDASPQKDGRTPLKNKSM